MQLGIIIETADAERVWNAFRLANTALEADHTVDVFLLGDGVEAPDIESDKFNPRGLLRQFVRSGGTPLACGTCLDTRGIDEGDLRPRSTMVELLALIERAEKVLTIG